MIEIVQAKSLTKVNGVAQNAYHLQIIATKPGFQVVAQHGQLGKKLSEVEKSERALSYGAAFAEFESLVTTKINGERFDVSATKIPKGTTIYADGHKLVQPTEEYLKANNPDTWSPTTPGAPGSPVGATLDLPTQLAAALMTTTLRLEDPSLCVVTIEKRGANITLRPSDIAPHVRRCALRTALEIGGDFTAEGVAVGMRFHLRSIDKHNLLKHTRPDWVTQDPAPQRAGPELLRSLMQGEIPSLIARVNASQALTFTSADLLAAAEVNPELLSILA
jgi:hypothetical protein